VRVIFAARDSSLRGQPQVTCRAGRAFGAKVPNLQRNGKVSARQGATEPRKTLKGRAKGASESFTHPATCTRSPLATSATTASSVAFTACRTEGAHTDCYRARGTAPLQRHRRKQPAMACCGGRAAPPGQRGQPAVRLDRAGAAGRRRAVRGQGPGQARAPGATPLLALLLSSHHLATCHRPGSAHAPVLRDSWLSLLRSARSNDLVVSAGTVPGVMRSGCPPEHGSCAVLGSCSWGAKVPAALWLQQLCRDGGYSQYATCLQQ